MLPYKERLARKVRHARRIGWVVGWLVRLSVYALLGWALWHGTFGCGSAVSVAPPPPPPPVMHSVALDWTASAGPDTYAGYLVYRSAQATGPWTKLTPSPINQLDYDDLTVKSGQTYDYYVTSVDTNNVESSPSSVVSATVPTP